MSGMIYPFNREFINPKEFIQFCKENLKNLQSKSNKDLLELAYRRDNIDWSKLFVNGSAIQMHEAKDFD